MEQEMLAVMAETSWRLDTGSSPSASQAEPRRLPLAPRAAMGHTPVPGWPDPGPPASSSVGAARILSVIAAGRNASGGILGNWFYPSVRCRRQDGGGGGAPPSAKAYNACHGPGSRHCAAGGGQGRRQRAMASMGMQVLGIALSVIGWLASILCCALPMWRETAFVGNNIVVAQIIWEGLWMNCVVQSTGQMQCKVYDSMLALPQDLQAARAMVVVAIVLAILGTLLAVAGGKCTNCVEDDTAKAKVMILSGVIFIVAGLLILIPISWSANTIIRDFYNPLVTDSQKRDLGSSLYVGWAASALLLLGGGILCCTCPPRGEKPYSAKFTAARSLPASNYV